jgi:hypothetical protein
MDAHKMITEEEIVAQLRISAGKLTSEDVDEAFEGLCEIRILIRGSQITTDLLKLEENLGDDVLFLVWTLRNLVSRELWHEYGGNSRQFPKHAGGPILHKISNALGIYLESFLDGHPLQQSLNEAVRGIYKLYQITYYVLEDSGRAKKEEFYSFPEPVPID